MTGAVGGPGGLARLAARLADVPPRIGEGANRPKPGLGHDTLRARSAPAAVAGPGAMRVGAAALPALRHAHARWVAHATPGDSGAPQGKRPPFDLGSLDFPLVFPMPPIDPVNPARVPHAPPPEGAKYGKTVPMLSAYQHEQLGMVFGQKVKYLDEQERLAFKVGIEGGKIVGADGRPFDTRDATVSGEKTGRAIYVMDHDGNLYLSNQAGIADFQHTSFLAGQPVAAAGTIRVEDGVVTEITRSSGHYRPGPEFLDQAVAELHARGVPPGFTVHKDV